MSHPESETLSLFLDADLPEARIREVEEHLAECPACRALLEDLQAIQGAARNLGPLSPPRDLWPEIADVLEGEASREHSVIPLHREPRGVRPRRTGTLLLSYPRAAAAGLALALFSGALGAALRSPVPAPAPGLTAAAPPPADRAVGEDGPPLVLQVQSASPELEAPAREVARLEELLIRHRGELKPETVRVLEKSLGVIDQAIQESLAALEQDPGNRFLRDHLQRALQAKAEYLKEATSLVAPES